MKHKLLVLALVLLAILVAVEPLSAFPMLCRNRWPTDGNAWRETLWALRSFIEYFQGTTGC